MKKILLLLLVSFLVFEPSASGLWKERPPKPPPISEYQAGERLAMVKVTKSVHDRYLDETKNFKIPYYFYLPGLVYKEKVSNFVKDMEFLSKSRLLSEDFRFHLVISDERAKDGHYFTNEKFKKVVEILGKYCERCSILELSLANVGDFSKIFAYVSAFKNLKSLEVGGARYSQNIKSPKVPLTEVSKVVTKIKSLKRLKLGPLSLTPGKNQEKSAGFEFLGSVTDLHLYRINVPGAQQKHSDENFNNLFISLGRFHQLKFLSLTEISDFESKHLGFIAKIPNLETIQLENLEFVGNKGVGLLKTCRELKNIEFYNLKNIGPGIGNELLKGLKGEFRSLEELTFFDCPKVPIIEMGGFLKYLKKLHVFRNEEPGIEKRITDVLGVVVSTRSKQFALKKLYLGGFRISFDSVLKIVERHKNLIVLSIPGCDDIKVHQVKMLVNKLPTLRILYVDNDIINYENVKALNDEFKGKVTVLKAHPHWA